MSGCESNCRRVATKFIKQNFMDRLLNRTIEEKIENHCHIDCIRSEGIKNFKKNGRWGFVPLFGFTEFFSSFFAFISLVCNIYFYKEMILNKLHNSPLKTITKLQYYICNAALLSSVMFHMRETTFTRFADYFTAFLGILVGLIAVSCRATLLFFPSIFNTVYRTSLFLGTIFYAFHVHKMAFVEFDYAYNKICCGIMILFSTLLDIIVFVKQRKSKHAKHILFYIGWLMLAGFSEILDISPIHYLFDSHALWHLLMAIAVPFYVIFLSGYIDSHCKNKKC